MYIGNLTIFATPPLPLSLFAESNFKVCLNLSSELYLLFIKEIEVILLKLN